MKKTLALFVTLLFLFTSVCFAAAEGGLTPGVYELTSYEVGDVKMDPSMMPDTVLTVNGDGTGLFLVQGVPSAITYDTGTIYMSGNPVYTFTVTGENSIRVSLHEVLYLNMALSGASEAPAETKAPEAALAPTPVPAATPAPAPEETKAPASEPTPMPPAAPAEEPADGRVTLTFQGIDGAASLKICRGSEGTRDGNWEEMADIDPKAASFTDEAPVSGQRYYKALAKFPDGREEALIYSGSALKETWSYNAEGKITAGYDYENEISYEYVYEKNVFRYRKKTYENLQAGEDYTYDQEISKISGSRSTSTTYALTLAQNYENCIGMSFDFEITQITKGKPFGTWRLYVRLFTKETWKEASTFTVKDGNKITVDKEFKTPFSICKVAFLGPNATYSCSTSKALHSITVKDESY